MNNWNQLKGGKSKEGKGGAYGKGKKGSQGGWHVMTWQ